MIPSKRQHLAEQLGIAFELPQEEVLEVLNQILGPPRYESDGCRAGHRFEDVGFTWVKGERRCNECEVLAQPTPLPASVNGTQRHCKWCSTPLPIRPPGQPGRPRLFCDRNCREKWTAWSIQRKKEIARDR